MTEPTDSDPIVLQTVSLGAWARVREQRDQLMARLDPMVQKVAQLQQERDDLAQAYTDLQETTNALRGQLDRALPHLLGDVTHAEGMAREHAANTLNVFNQSDLGQAVQQVAEDRGIGCWAPYGQLPGDEGYVPPAVARWRVVIHMLGSEDGPPSVIMSPWEEGEVDVEEHGEWLVNRFTNESPWQTTATHDGRAIVFHVEDVDYVVIEKENQA